MRHPNIVSYKYYIVKKAAEADEYHTIMELMEGGPMSGFMNSCCGKNLHISRVSQIGQQILSAVNFLH